MKIWYIRQDSLVGVHSFQGKSGLPMDAETRGNGRKMTLGPELILSSHFLDLIRFCEDFGGV